MRGCEQGAAGGCRDGEQRRWERGRGAGEACGQSTVRSSMCLGAGRKSALAATSGEHG